MFLGVKFGIQEFFRFQTIYQVCTVHSQRSNEEFHKLATGGGKVAIRRRARVDKVLEDWTRRGRYLVDAVPLRPYKTNQVQ